MAESTRTCAGIDVGTECIKVVILDEGGDILGSAILERRGYFQDRVQECLTSALADAKLLQQDLTGICATGFGSSCVPAARHVMGETACHALGAFHFFSQPMSLIDIGGRDPKVIHVNAQGNPSAIHTLRRCAAGIGSFLNFASRQLDVHPARLQELASIGETPVHVGSYCSMFSSTDLLVALREGHTREDAALGVLDSIAERLVEIGGFEQPIRVSGGVAEYFPGILTSLARKLQIQVEAITQPIMVGAVGAALWMFREEDKLQEVKGEQS